MPLANSSTQASLPKSPICPRVLTTPHKWTTCTSKTVQPCPGTPPPTSATAAWCTGCPSSRTFPPGLSRTSCLARRWSWPNLLLYRSGLLGGQWYISGLKSPLLVFCWWPCNLLCVQITSVDPITKLEVLDTADIPDSNDQVEHCCTRDIHGQLSPADLGGVRPEQGPAGAAGGAQEGDSPLCGGGLQGLAQGESGGASWQTDNIQTISIRDYSSGFLLHNSGTTNPSPSTTSNRWRCT